MSYIAFPNNVNVGHVSTHIAGLLWLHLRGPTPTRAGPLLLTRILRLLPAREECAWPPRPLFKRHFRDDFSLDLSPTRMPHTSPHLVAPGPVPPPPPATPACAAPPCGTASPPPRGVARPRRHEALAAPGAATKPSWPGGGRPRAARRHSPPADWSWGTLRGSPPEVQQPTEAIENQLKHVFKDISVPEACLKRLQRGAKQAKRLHGSFRAVLKRAGRRRAAYERSRAFRHSLPQHAYPHPTATLQ